jgi:hypothetical protein
MRALPLCLLINHPTPLIDKLVIHTPQIQKRRQATDHCAVEQAGPEQLRRAKGQGLWLGVNVDDALIFQGAVAVVASRAVAVE